MSLPDLLDNFNFLIIFFVHFFYVHLIKYKTMEILKTKNQIEALEKEKYLILQENSKVEYEKALVVKYVLNH